MNSIEWTRKSVKQLRGLPQLIQKRIYRAVDGLKAFPATTDVKKLNNHQYDYRLRMGDYRIFFNYDGKIKIVLIQEVKKRDNRTY